MLHTKNLFLFIFSICSIIEIFGVTTKVGNVQEFNKAVAASVPGDTIILANQNWSDVRLDFSGKQGTESKPIVLKAESFGQVIISGNSNLNIGDDYLVVKDLIFKNAISARGNLVEFRSGRNYANYSRLTGCVFIDCNPVLSTTTYRWVAMFGTHNRMDHCYFRGKTNGAPTFSVIRTSPEPNYAQIDSNYFAARPPLRRNGGETVQIGTSPFSLFPSRTVVEYNLFEQCNGEVEIVSNKSCENVYRYNTFLNCGGALTLRHGNRCTVEGNFFIGNHMKATGGVRVIGEDHKIINNYFCGLIGTGSRSAISIMDGFNITDTTDAKQLSSHLPVKRIIIEHNTFADNVSNIEIGSGRDEELTVKPEYIAFSQNVIVAKNGTKLPPVIVELDTINHVKWKLNYFYGGELGLSPIPNGIITDKDPLLRTGSDGLYRPIAGSPLVNAGESGFTIVTLDMDGQLRDSNPDIGADEMSSAQIKIKPLSASDVGPPNLDAAISK